MSKELQRVTTVNARTGELVEAEVDLSALAEQLVAQAHSQGIELTGPDGLLTGLTRQVLQSALEAELADHLGYDRYAPAGRGSGNSRNGSSPIVYTTNAIESLNARFRSAVRRRGHFPNEQAALKVLYLAARHRQHNRANPTGETAGWKGILNVLAMTYGDRLGLN